VGDFTQGASLPVTVWTGSLCGTSNSSAARVTAGGDTFVSTAWGTANKAYYIPVNLPWRYPVQNFFVYNNATVAGSVDVGIYNAQDMTQLWHSGATAMSGASALQFFAKDIILDPGPYYLAMSSTSTTATYACYTTLTATRQRYLGGLKQTSANPLPATMTPAAIDTARVPLIGFTYLPGTPYF